MRIFRFQRLQKLLFTWVFRVFRVTRGIKIMMVIECSLIVIAFDSITLGVAVKGRKMKGMYSQDQEAMEK